MTDFFEEIAVVCSSRELAWCEANCGEDCAARAQMIQEHEQEAACR